MRSSKLPAMRATKIQTIFKLKSRSTTEEFGHDLEHVEVLQRKFDEFQKDMASQEFLVTDVCETADKLVSDQHPESSVVTDKKAELLEAWARLRLRLLIII